MKEIILKEGDIVKLNDGTEFVIDISDGEPMRLFIDKTQKGGYYVVEIKRVKEYETIYKKPQEILDKEEKEYLRAVIRPFRKKVEFIKKSTLIDGDYIVIGLYKEVTALPSFKKDTMYKGMEVNKHYTIKELGL